MQRKEPDAEVFDLVSDDDEEGSSLMESYLIEPFSEDIVQKCMECALPLKPKYSLTSNSIMYYICNDQCLMTFETEKRIASSSMGVRNLQIMDSNAAAKIKFKRSCGECTKDVSDLGTILSWETMEFCNEQCLGKYQWDKLANCTSCGNEVDFAHLGKYSVRFGHDIRQFCNRVCSLKYKHALKVCSSCHKDISRSNDRCATSFGAKKQFKGFCKGKCLLKYVIAYDKQLNLKRRVCVLCEKKTDTPIAMEHGGLTKLFCDRSCFGDFKLIYGIVTDECGFCKKYVDTKTLMKYSTYFGDAHHAFCSERCKNIYLIADRKQISCNQCGMSKFTFDMIQSDIYHGGQLAVCSLYCFKLYYGTQHIGRCPGQCSYCQKSLQEGSHGMDDTTVAVFCSAPCLTAFQKQCGMTLVPPDMPSTSRQTSEQPKKSDPTGLETSAFANLKSSVSSTMSASKHSNLQNKHPQKVEVSNNTVPSKRNVGTMCEVTGQDKSAHIKPTGVTKGIQTDKRNPIILPIPFPIGVPLPMLGGLPIPLPLPCPIPIPVPIFILTTCETVSEIMKKIQVPTNPLEAELIMMANMVADKAQMNDSLDTEIESGKDLSASVVANLPLASETNLAPELDDVPQEKSGICEIPLDAIQDWEDVISPSIIIVTRGDEKESSRTTNSHQQDSRSSDRAGDSPSFSTKKQKLEYVHEARADRSSFQPPECELTEKIEANMSLNYQPGLHAWNNWVLTRSATTENSSAAAPSFNTEILHHTVDELSYGLCLFVKEIREPNGQPYPPDIIYYFCLCIQTYLLKNARAENIFFDSSYKKFTECLDELAQQFLAACNDSSYIVTHVREEYLWESHQLGAHSPYVLLYTIMYFNTKLFNLEIIADHRQLSFLKVMKRWQNFKESGRSQLHAQKRFNNTSSLSQEQEFIRSPEQLYKFYLTKCPERLKKQDGAFYLLPASDCSPDSPAWFSSRALPQNDFKKMFNRIKFVKEIHLAPLYN